MLFRRIKRLALLFVFFLGIFLIALYAYFHSENVFDCMAQEAFLRSDASEEGESEGKLSKSDSSISIDFRLRSGVPTPYAGVAFELVLPGEMLREKFFDFSQYDSVWVRMRASRMPKATLRFSVHDPLHTIPGQVSSVRPVDFVAPVSRAFGDIYAAVSDFSVPEKWFDQMGIDSPDEFRFLERGLRFEILTAHGAMLGIPDDFEIEKIRFWGKNRRGLLYSKIALSLWILIGIIGFVFYLRKNSKKLSEEEKKRLNDAQKLLETTDWLEAKIALQMGFSSVRKFKKSFYALYQKTPSQWRKAHARKSLER